MNQSRKRGLNIKCYFFFLTSKLFVLPELLSVQSHDVNKANKPTLTSGKLLRVPGRSCVQLPQTLKLHLIMLRYTVLGCDSWFHFRYFSSVSDKVTFSFYFQKNLSGKLNTDYNYCRFLDES